MVPGDEVALMMRIAFGLEDRDGLRSEDELTVDKIDEIDEIDASDAIVWKENDASERV